MRIGMISGEYPPQQGGVGAYTQILSRALADAGHAVAVLSGPAARENDPRLTLDALQNWGPGCWTAVDHWARARHLDVLNLQYQTAAYGMSPWIHLIPGRVSLPVVVTFHDLRFPYLFPKAGPLRPWIVRFLARSAAGVIATNAEDFTALSTHPHPALIPIGSNILTEAPPAEAITEARRRAGATPDDFLIVNFGLFNDSKGLLELVSAAGALLERGLPVRLLLIGSAGSSDPANAAFEAKLRDRVAKLPQPDRVTFAGFLPDAQVDALLRAADAVALPFLDGASARRGSLMAALRAGAAIVSTQPAALDLAFMHERTMLLVPPGDAGALADALARLHTDAALCARLQTGAAEASRRFEWPAIAAEVAAFLAHFVQSRRPA